MSNILISKKDWRKGEDGVRVHCPNCGSWPVLSSHTIDSEGNVHPSIWHQCADVVVNDKHEDWHIFGTLEGWQS